MLLVLQVFGHKTKYKQIKILVSEETAKAITIQPARGKNVCAKTHGVLLTWLIKIQHTVGYKAFVRDEMISVLDPGVNSVQYPSSRQTQVVAGSL